MYRFWHSMLQGWCIWRGHKWTPWDITDIERAGRTCYVTWHRHCERCGMHEGVSCTGPYDDDSEEWSVSRLDIDV